MRNRVNATAAAASALLTVLALLATTTTPSQAQAPVQAEARVQAENAKRWTSLDAEDFIHACTVRSDHTAWCWGWNRDRMLNVGDVGKVLRPTRMPGRDWVAISTEWDASCGLKTDATTWCWGRVRSDGKDRSLEPVLTSLPPSTAIALGAGVCGINSDNELWCARTVEADDEEASPPVQQPGEWLDFDYANGDLCGVLASTRIACVVGDEFGMDEDAATLDRIGRKKGFTSVDVASRSSGGCAVRDDGTVWCWGDNSWGRLGDGTSGGHYKADPVRAGPRHVNFKTVSSGAGQGCAIDGRDRLWCWGYNSVGAVGDGTRKMRKRPVLVDSDLRWRMVATGPTNSTYGVAKDGDIYAWGMNYRGVLGVDPDTGTEITRRIRAVLTPVRVLGGRGDP